MKTKTDPVTQFSEIFRQATKTMIVVETKNMRMGKLVVKYTIYDRSEAERTT